MSFKVISVTAHWRSTHLQHLEWDIAVYWRCVLHQCAATLITFNNILMSIEGAYYDNVQQHLSPWMIPWCLLEVCTTSMCSNIDDLEWHRDVYWRNVYYVNVQQHWSPLMTSWCLMEVCTTSMSSNTDYVEWDLDIYWRCVLRQCAATLIILNDILMSIAGVYCVHIDVVHTSIRHQDVIQGDQCCCTLT
jgi:hypothetical protein